MLAWRVRLTRSTNLAIKHARWSFTTVAVFYRVLRR